MKLLWWVITIAVVALLYFVRRGRGDAISAQVQRQIEDADISVTPDDIFGKPSKSAGDDPSLKDT